VRASILLAAGAIAFSAIAAAAQYGRPAPPVYPYPLPPPVVSATPTGNEAVGSAPVDRKTRCLQYAHEIGVPADQMYEYMKRCESQ
jgi:hypothetical protein